MAMNSAANIEVGAPSLPTPANSYTGMMQRGINMIYGNQASNNAYSAQQASELRDWQEQQNKLAMDFNSAEAAKNRNWQEYMSNTAHQREIRDLKAAGLNPVLSVTGGNGAAVTSGATASGVTSSGAMGQTDTSANQAIVNLLGSILNSKTALETQKLNAENNLAVAEKNAAASQLVAQINGLFGNERARISGEYGLKQTDLSGQYSLKNTDLAGRYGLQQTKLAGEYSNRSAAISGSYNLGAAHATANAAMQRLLQEQNYDLYMKQNYPQNFYGAVSALTNSLLEGSGAGNLNSAVGTLANKAVSAVKSALGMNRNRGSGSGKGEMSGSSRRAYRQGARAAR